MRTKMMRVFPETALERVLEALERELVAATDEELLEAASDLGMQPGMKGSAAFLGLRYPAMRRAEDFFDPQWMLASAALPSKPELPRAAPPRARSRTRSAGRKSPRPPKEPSES
ncbi:MAG: hypothetical protein ACLPTM_10000 [Steroidobacteraceae bacterium]